MKTYQDVVEETVEYYKNNPFGFDSEKKQCVYLGDKGQMCAVGRCLKNPELLGNKALNADTVIKEDLGGGLKDEYIHLDNVLFWQDLQSYHDMLAVNLDPSNRLRILRKTDWNL